MKRNGLCMLAAAAVLGLTGQAHDTAASTVLAEYDFAGNAPSAINVAGGLSAGDAAFGPWVDEADNPSDPEFTDNLALARGDDTRSPTFNDLLSNAIDGDNYLAFTLTGSDISIETIRFDFVTTGSVSMSAHLLSDLTGLTSSDSLSTTTHLGTDSSAVVVNLAGNVDLQNISGSVEFRIYYSDSTFNSSNVLRVDNIIAEGAVPEPRSLAVLAVGGVLLARRRWRR